MRKTYTLNVAGVTRELPLCPVNEKLDIAAFVMFSDVELTVACAEALLKKVPEFDIIVIGRSERYPAGLRDEPPERQTLYPGPERPKTLHGGACCGGGCFHYDRGRAEARHRP